MRFVGRIVLPIALFVSSCRVAPPKAETPKKPAKSSLASERYKNTVEDRLGPIWYRLVKINQDSLQAGTVETIFQIPVAGGQARNLKVTSNTGGRMDELVARMAIEQLRAPPVPPEIAAQLPEGYFFLEEAFTIYDEAHPPPSPTPRKKG
jgi:hypothetical protein